MKFNDNYDKNLIDTPYYRVIASQIKELYPLVYDHLSKSSLLEAYIEPKIVQFLELQLDFQKQGFSPEGSKESAYRDINSALDLELENIEHNVYLEQFDLDKNEFIDTEEL